MMNNLIFIPKGILAVDANDAILKARREELKRRLLAGQNVTLSNNGNVMNDNGQNSTISIPKGKLADDAALKARREELKRRLLEGRTVTLTNNGNVMNENESGSSLNIPGGKLAAAQWYDLQPDLLEMEKVAMHKAFPAFSLNVLDDGRLYWIGELEPGIYSSKFGTPMKYTVMAVYNNNHPAQVMGSSVRVYPVLPDVDDLIQKCGFRPFHLLSDSTNNLYLCTNEADNVLTGTTITSAASVLGWAVKWLMAYELVLTGDLSKETFNQHGGI